MGKFNQFVYDNYSIFKRPAEMPARCLVHFRPSENWNGENFGFDWLRVGDTNVGQDNHYAKLTGKYKTRKNIVCDNLNKWDKMDDDKTSCSFKKDITMYRDLLKDRFVTYLFVPWKKPDSRKKEPKNEEKMEVKKTDYTYYVPIMTLKNGNTANLTLRVELENNNNLPIRIELKQQCGGTNFNISPDTLPVANGTYNVAITCNSTFSELTFIEALAVYIDVKGNEYKLLCGLLRVFPNNRIFNADLLIVNVTTRPTRTGTTSGDDMSILNNLSDQLLLNYTITNINISLNFTDFEKHLSPNKEIIDPNKDKDAHNRVVQQVNRAFIAHVQANGLPFNHYDNHHKIFLLDERSTLINGRTYDTEHFILLLNQRLPETLTHELLHSFLLPHPFVASDLNANAKYTYKAKKTENYLDYSHLDNKPRFSTWYWQWEIVWLLLDPAYVMPVEEAIYAPDYIDSPIPIDKFKIEPNENVLLT